MNDSSMAPQAECTFARATRSHLPRMIEIERLCFAEPWPESSFLDELANERAAYFVALSPEDGAVVGYCGYWRVAGEAHIMNLAVSPAAQRKGIGRRLLGLLVRDAAEHGIATALLEAREDNAAALALYEQFGFVRCGLRVNYYLKEQKDAIVMQADISADLSDVTIEYIQE